MLLNLLSKEVQNSLNTVLDLGCGIQYFKDVLCENGLNPTYVGVDLYPQKEDNILCDFNKGEFPNFDYKKFELIVCAGLFEYIIDLKKFVNKICSLEPDYILCSYNFLNITKQNEIWVKRLNQKDFFNLFFDNNYCLNSYTTSKGGGKYGYILFCKKEKM
ncbi:MAG: methyltransferase domain-containing protein [Helicobacter sp.]|nr:methyltransferase domain-containing protein [Helicobacter sp.]